MPIFVSVILVVFGFSQKQINFFARKYFSLNNKSTVVHFSFPRHVFMKVHHPLPLRVQIPRLTTYLMYCPLNPFPTRDGWRQKSPISIRFMDPFICEKQPSADRVINGSYQNGASECAERCWRSGRRAPLWQAASLISTNNQPKSSRSTTNFPLIVLRRFVGLLDDPKSYVIALS